MSAILLAALIVGITEPISVRVKSAKVQRLAWEDYLARVVEKEAGPGFPLEALRAQAVVARTYALQRIERAKVQKEKFDIEAGTLGQALSEKRGSEACRNAVSDTRGLVLSAEGRLIESFFHASCGGWTAEAKDVFRAESPGLESVKCLYCRDSRNFAWSGSLSRTGLSAAAKAIGLPGFIGFQPYEEDSRGRILSVKAAAPGWRAELPLTFLRRMAGESRLKSGLFDCVQTGGHILYSGWGYGHGVGLCQEGARGQAKRGKNFRAILKFYFPGAELVPVPDS